MKRAALYSAMIVALVGSASQRSFGQATSLQELEESTTRPTVEELVSIVGLHPATNPYESLLINDGRFLSAKAHLDVTARGVAQMELAFPKAIWAPLGRDAALFGDLLEVFYLSIGQAGRVVRLNGSGSSIRGVDEAKLVRFMESAGMDLGPSGRPFIGLDRTAYSDTSQASQLLTAVYNAYEARGGNRKDLVRRVNFLGLSAGDGTATSAFAVDSFFFRVHPKPTVDQILQIGIGPWTDTKAWHETYGPLAEIDGKFEGIPGKPSSLLDRRIVLGEMIWLLQNIADAEFTLAVVKAATALHYKFELPKNIRLTDLAREASERRAIRLEREADQKIRDIRDHYKARLSQSVEELRQALSSATVVPERKIKLSIRETLRISNWLDAHGASFTYRSAADWLERQINHYNAILRATDLEGGALSEYHFPSINPLITHFLTVVTEGYQGRKFTGENYLRLIDKAFSAAERTPQLLDQLQTLTTLEPLIEPLVRQHFYCASVFEYYGGD